MYVSDTHLLAYVSGRVILIGLTGLELPLVLLLTDTCSSLESDCAVLLLLDLPTCTIIVLP